MKMAITLAAVGSVLGSCKDMHSDEDDQEFHGGPSTTVCGVRWSHDVTTFHCDGPRLRVDEVRPFTKVQSVHLADTVVTRGSGARLESVTDLAVNRSSVDAELLASTFPRVRSLVIDSTALDVRDLRSLTGLKFLLLHKTAPPDAASVAALASLTTLMLNFVECSQPACDYALAKQIRALRPDLEIKVDGHDVR
jgi:hypothetical protein